MIATRNADALRREIIGLLDQIEHPRSLFFLRWIVQMIASDHRLPPKKEMRRLYEAFVRIADAIDDKEKIDPDDWNMLSKYLEEGPHLSRVLAKTIQFYRSKEGVSRLQLARRCGWNVRAILVLERGHVKDISLEDMARLARALRVNPVKFMDTFREFDLASRRGRPIPIVGSPNPLL
jgi:Helix-turn-helix domain